MARFRMISSRGFVLSFSTFSLAVFLIIFAQIHFTHMQNIQFDSGDVFRQTTPARVMQDIALDFNELTGQTISIDQNADWAMIKVTGRVPSVLSTRTNLLRHQTNLFPLGRDSNTSIFLDLNISIADNNIFGRTNHGLRWRHSFDENKFRIYPAEANFYPSRFDVNIFSELPYESIGITDIFGTIGGGFHVTNYTVNYTDTNSDHNYSRSASFIGNQALNLLITYDVNGVATDKILSLGAVDAGDSSTNFGTAINGTSEVPWRYSISYTMPNDGNGTRAGYDINALIRGRDFNVDTNVIWTYNGQ